MDDLDMLQPDHSVELVDGPGNVCRRPFVVPGRECMTGVEANADARIAKALEHRRDLFEPCADTAAQAGVVLDEEPRCLRVGTLQDFSDVTEDRGEAGFKNGA